MQVSGAVLRLGVIKRDDVRRTLMLEEIPVHLRHFSCADQMNGQLEGFDAQLRVEQVKGDLPKQPRINAADALTVQQRERPAHVARPRCSS